MIERLNREPSVLEGYREDSSGMIGTLDAVARPRDVRDLREILEECCASATTVLPVGGRTTTTGASVPRGGVVVDMTSMPEVLEVDPARRIVRASAGVTLRDLRDHVASFGLDLPVDPTSERTCTVGGAVGTNASGPSTFRYGPMAAWVRAVALVDGAGREHTLRSPGVRKHALGPVASQDPVAWFVGSEGHLGVAHAVELSLAPRAAARAALVAPMDDARTLAACVVALRRDSERLAVRKVEWLDASCCALASAAGGPTLNAGPFGSLHVEVEGDDGAAALGRLEEAAGALERQGVAIADADVLADAAAVATFAELRHLVPSTLNERGRALRDAEGGGKLGTDWSVPLHALADMLDGSYEELGALESVDVFAYGHIGDGHPHFNLLCHDTAARNACARRLALQLERVAASGGVPVSEHGVGKLKRELVRPYLPPGFAQALAGLKQVFDPRRILARGNLVALR